MPANYDSTAWFYDALSKMVYGNTLLKAQKKLLYLIKPRWHILIVGGGTGKILEYITQLHPSGLHITYVEISEQMTVRARQRQLGNNRVTFSVCAIEEAHLAPEYDAVITAFLFDNFTEQSLPAVFNHIHQALKPGGIWLNTDFQLTGKWWQPLLLKSMYTFFKLFSDIPVNTLPNIARQFALHAYQPGNQHTFYGEFVKTGCYTKLL